MIECPLAYFLDGGLDTDRCHAPGEAALRLPRVDERCGRCRWLLLFTVHSDIMAMAIYLQWTHGGGERGKNDEQFSRE